MKNYYKILGVKQDAGNDAIKDAYRKLYTRYHSEREKGNRYSEEKIVDISIAYNTLINEDKRRDYNRILNSILSVPETMSIRKELKSPDIQTAPAPAASNRINRYGLYFGLFMLVISTTFFVVLINRTIDKTFMRDSSLQTADYIDALPEEPVLPQAVTVVVQRETIEDQPQPLAAATPRTTAEDGKATEKKIFRKTLSAPPAQEQTRTATGKKAHADSYQHASLSETDVNPQYGIGATKKDVLKIQGTPNVIIRYDEADEEWRYGSSSVSFRNNVVTSFHNDNNNLMLQN